MAKLIVVTADDSDALLRAAAAPFCSNTPTDLPLLALRQGGLRDAVYELAAAGSSPGWLGNPIVVFNELAGLFAPERAPLDGFEREALIEGLVARSTLGALGNPRARRTIVASLDRLFGDLSAEGVAPSEVERALGTLAGDRWLERRNADVALLYASYCRAIPELPARNGIGPTDGRDGLLAAALAIEGAGASGLAALRRPFETSSTPRSVDIYGLADLRRGWRRLLGALHASPYVDELRLYVLNNPAGHESEVRAWAVQHGAELRTVPDTRPSAAILVALRSSVLTDSAARIAPSPALSVTAAPDITRELEDVARTIKAMLVGEDSGAPRVAAREIAVIARQARPYLTRAAEVFSRYGIPVYARLRHTLSDVPALAALCRVFDAAADGWSVRRLRELAESPYFDVRFDRRLLQEAAADARPLGLDPWNEALKALAAKPSEDDDPERAKRRAGRVSELRQAFDAFAAEASQLDAPRTRREWIELAIAMLGGMTAEAPGFLGFAMRVQQACPVDAPDVLRDAARIDSAALRGAIELLAAWRRATELDANGEACDVERWVMELRQMLSQHEISVRAGERGGVQLIEATAAEGQSWAHVFIVGMSVGSFPSEPSVDVLFSDDERARLGEQGLPIDSAVVWREREQALFRALINAPSTTLHLSYAYADANGAPQLPSAFLEDVIGRVDAEADDVTRRIPGSRVAPAVGEPVWSTEEALRVGASALRDVQSAADARAMLAIARHPAERSDPRHPEERSDEGSLSSQEILRFAQDDRYVAQDDRLRQLLHAVHVERFRDRQRADEDGKASRQQLAHPWNGAIDDPALLEHLSSEFGDRVWSATQLESYGRCGFSFFGKYVLRVNEVENDDEELSAADAGSIMHSALAATYSRLNAHDSGDPLSTSNVDVALSIVGDEVAKAFAAAGLRAAGGIVAARVHETTVLLQEYVRWEIAQNEKAKDRVRPAHMELSFGMDDSSRPPATLEADGRKLRLRGQIDRVDEVLAPGAEGYRYIVDHKSGDSALKPVGVLQKSGAMLQLALYIAALDQILPGTRAWGGAYQLVRKRASTASLNRCSIGPKGQVREAELKTEKTADAVVREAARIALGHVDGVLRGRFAARVPEGTDCLGYCAFAAACREDRIAGGWQ